MRLKNLMLAVEDVERSKRFYHELFGLDVILDSDGYVMLTEGLVLRDRQTWQQLLGKEIISEHHSCELYFEEKNIEAFVEKLDRFEPPVRYVNRLAEYGWGQKVVRFYDPDGHLIEVGTPV